MTKLQIARIAEMFKNNIDTALSRDQQSDAAAMARIARNLAVELANMHGSFRFHSFYRQCGLTTDGFIPIPL